MDNPDQRISEDVDYFTKVTLDFLPLHRFNLQLQLPPVPWRVSWAPVLLRLDILDSVLNLAAWPENGSSDPWP